MTAPAIILFGHGSRDPLWHQPIEAVAERIRAASPGTPVACAYLELSQPDLATAVGGLVAQGVTAVQVLPMFLGVGRHAREDLPKLVDSLRQRHPDVAISLRLAVGEHEKLLETLVGIALE